MGSRMRPSAISSKASPTKSCPRSPRRGGAHSKSPSCGRTRATMPSIRVRSASRARRALQRLAEVSPSSLRSTTCSGSTPRRRTRSRSRCAAWRRTVCFCCSRGASAPEHLRRSSSRRSTRSASGGSRSVRSASARSIASCAIVSANSSHARPCCGSTSSRAGIRSTPCSWRPEGREPSAVPRRSKSFSASRSPGFPAPTREALALASAFGTTPERLLRRAGVPPAALLPAFEANVIERTDGTIRFTHPLLSSVLYAGLGEARRERSRAHRRDRGRPTGPRTAPRARRWTSLTPRWQRSSRRPRRLPAIVAPAPQQPSSQSRRSGSRPPTARDERRRRALAAARAHHGAGEWTRARTIADELLAEAGIDSLRAEALVLLAELESVDRGVVLLEEALAEAGSRPALQSVIHCRLAWATRFRKGYVRALEHATRGGRARGRPRRRASCENGRRPCRRSSAGSRATPTDRPCPRSRTTSQRLWAARSSCRRRPSPSSARLQARTGGDGSVAARARARRVARARRAAERAGALGSRLGRVLGRALGACGRACRRGLRHRDPVRARGAAGPPSDRARRRPPRASSSSRASTPSVPSSSPRSSSRSIRRSTSPSSGSSPSGAATGRRPRSGSRRRTRRRPRSRGVSRASAGGARDHVELLLELGRVDEAVRILDAWEADATRARTRLGARARDTLPRARRRRTRDVDGADSLLEQAVAQHEARRRSVRPRPGAARARRRPPARAAEARARATRSRAALDGFEQLGAATLGREGARASSGASAAARARKG